MGAANSFFEKGDEFLDGGGKAGVDAVSALPGPAGELADAAKAEYASLHMMNDFANGDWRGGAKHGAEATMSAIEALPGAHEILHGIPQSVELAGDAYDWVTGGDIPLTQKIGQSVPMVSPKVHNAVFDHYAH